jgi:Domain of unknown function (DUF1877)
MSMIGNFLAITQEQLNGLLADPDSVPDLLYPEAGNALPAGLMDVDKAWHGIHFLLTGSQWEGTPPCSLAILGGVPIGQDVGYGPARYLLPNQVREVAQALASLPPSELAKRYSPKAMDEAGIYPEIWERDGDDGLHYVLSFYESVVKYYQDAAGKNHAMLLFLN